MKRRPPLHCPAFHTLSPRLPGALRVLFLSTALLGTAAMGVAVEASDSDFSVGHPNRGEPTIVTVGVYLNDIDRIDDIDQQFSADLFVLLSWVDPRLALPSEGRSGSVRTVDLEEIWTPRVLIVNDRSLTPRLPRIAEIEDDGTVKFRQRLSGNLAVDLELQDFPFDTQLLPIEVVSYQYSTDELQFSPQTRIVGESGSFSAAGWKMELLEPKFDEFHAPGRDIMLPRLTFLISAERSGSYYGLTMFLPMSLIVLMAWSVFWLKPDLVPPRVAISTASIFSLIAFGFSIRLSLPKVSYMTRADFFVVGCTLLVFLALSVIVAGSRWVASDQMDRARRLNAIARWLYILIFGAVALTAFA